MLRGPVRLSTPRFTSVKDSEVTLMRFIETYHQRANLLVWTKAEVYLRRIKGCGTSQL
jgi:hypothetical protein